MKAIITTKKKILQQVFIGFSMGLIIGLGCFVILENNDLKDLRDRASQGLVYVDDNGMIYKCEVK